jgi:hypothetical protein
MGPRDGYDGRDPVYEKLLELGATLSASAARLDVVQQRLEENSEILRANYETLTTLKATSADHEKRLTSLESYKSNQSGWRSKIGGISIGVTVTLTMLASLIGLLMNTLKVLGPHGP